MTRSFVTLLTAGCGAVLLAVAAPGGPLIAASGSCERLSSLKLPDTTIATAETVAAGAFKPSTAGEPAEGRGFRSVPAFCRVAAAIAPTSDSDIKVEVWLPVAGWNGKFQAVGNGGWAGTISYAAMGRALEAGYATASTDTGHTGANGAFALDHPEKLVDYAHRAVHEMTVKAKAIVDAFYGSAPKQSYWNGCSTGGRQALMEAQRYPADYDGIIAGAAANPKTHLDAWRISMSQAMFKDHASFIPESKYPAIHQAVLKACDALDGLTDGLIDDPTRCRFDPGVLECKNGDGPGCLTAAQVAAAQAVMKPAKDRRTGRGDLSRPRSGHRADVGTPARRARPVRDRARTVQVRHLPQSELGLADVRPRTRYGPRRQDQQGHARRDRPQPHRLHAARREAPHVSRLERPEHRPTGEREFLHARARDDEGSGGRRGVAAAVHGPGHGTLRRRRRAEHVRHDERDRAVGRERDGAGTDRRLAQLLRGRWTARVRCAHTRRSRDTPGPAASTTRLTSCAGRRRSEDRICHENTKTRNEL
jgi:hypothetical protein